MNLQVVLAQLLTTLPLYAVWLGAVIAAAMTWQRHPRVSALVAGAAGISFIGSILFSLVTIMVPQMLARSGLGYENMRMVMGGVGFLHGLVSAFAFALLVYAAMTQRSPA